jgi:medium-chain acyl-[acyl-carrier-protein] hydrolase
MVATASTIWITCFQPNPRAALSLFCFPYAGGSATIFKTWADGLPRSVEVYAVQLPGRERRLQERPLTSMAELAGSISQALRPYLTRPFALFGHSMGAKLGFEVALNLRMQQAPEPSSLIVSGCRAPHLPSTDELTYQLPESEFIEKLRRLNGTPREILEHPELMQLLLPTLRADFQVVETYVPTLPVRPLGCRLTAYGGLLDEEVSRADLEAWRVYTKADFVVRMLPGDHFFLQQSEFLLLSTVGRDLQRTADQ